ncbi:hypothetical protein Tco_0295000 [Tanacetum coccineum]
MSTLPLGRRHCRLTEGLTGLPPDARECKDEFEGRSTTLGFTLITTTKPIGIFVEYLRNHRSKGIPWCRSKGLVESLRNINYLANTLNWLGVDDVHRYFELGFRILECMDDGDSRVAKEAKLFDALEHKSVVIEVDNQKITIFSKAPLRAFGEPFMRKMVNDVNVEIHGVKFKADFVVLDYVNEGEPSILFGRDFLATTKSQVDFGLGEIWMNLTKFKEGIDVEEIPPTSTILPQLIYHPLTPRQKEEMKGKERLNKKEFSEKDKVGIIEHGLPKKMCDPGNYVLLMKINGVFEMVALVDIGASIIRKLRRWEKSKIAIIDIGRGTLCIDDGVIRHTYFPKPWSKSYVEAFKMEGEDDWLGSFEVGRDEDGNVKYDPVAPSFIDIEDDMERALAIEA